MKDPRQAVSPGDRVQVRVLKVDLAKNQISLTMKTAASAERRPKKDRGGRPPRRTLAGAAKPPASRSRAPRGEGSLPASRPGRRPARPFPYDHLVFPARPSRSRGGGRRPRCPTTGSRRKTARQRPPPSTTPLPFSRASRTTRRRGNDNVAGSSAPMNPEAEALHFSAMLDEILQDCLQERRSVAGGVRASPNPLLVEKTRALGAFGSRTFGDDLSLATFSPPRGSRSWGRASSSRGPWRRSARGPGRAPGPEPLGRGEGGEAQVVAKGADESAQGPRFSTRTGRTRRSMSATERLSWRQSSRISSSMALK